MLVVEISDNFICINTSSLSQYTIWHICYIIFEGKRYKENDEFLQIFDVTYSDLIRLNEYYKFIVM